MERKSLLKSLRTKTVCEEVADESDQTGTVDRKPDRGKNVRCSFLRTLIQFRSWCSSQESALGTHKTIRQIAQNIGISKTSVHRIVKRDLKLQRFRKRKAQDLTAANKFAHLLRVRQAETATEQISRTHSSIRMVFRC